LRGGRPERNGTAEDGKHCQYSVQILFQLLPPRV
jgi:hypothetical protein